MTLKEWCATMNILPTHPTTEKGAVSVILYKEPHQNQSELWHLDDYTVSSVSGVVVWLVPKR
jgi:hypothetical protein